MWWIKEVRTSFFVKKEAKKLSLFGTGVGISAGAFFHGDKACKSITLGVIDFGYSSVVFGMRIFKTKVFRRFALRAGISDRMLASAVMRAESGLVDADLGGGVIKQRIARPGEGKSGGFRTIILLKFGERAVFVYGFGKNERDNISGGELAMFRQLANSMLTYDEFEIASALRAGALIEVVYG